MLGVPDNQATFAASVQRDVAPALAEFRKLPPPPPLPAVTRKAVTDHPSASQSAGAALLKKLATMFKRETPRE
jgi:hypothetical protein